MSTDPTRVRAVIAEFLVSVDKSTDGLTDETGLYADGLELDSLAAAELSALLEDEFGTDPFTGAPVPPETVGDIVAFYGVATSA